MNGATMNSNGKRPKVVLFNPINYPGVYKTEQLQPLPVLSVSGLPLQNGYDVTIVDASVTPDYQARVLEACKDALCFGTTSIIGYQTYHSALVSREVRKAFPNLPIIAGGWFPSIKQDMVIEQACADVVVMGQGEITFMEVLEALRTGSSLEGIDGIAFRKNGEIVTNPRRKITDLNSLPPMPYHLIDFEKYFASDSCDFIKLLLNSHTGTDNMANAIRSLYYFSSYGCPDACTFCCSPGVTQRRYTAIEADRIVDEIEYLVRKHHINYVEFQDANWAVDQRRVLEFCEGILKRGIKIHWAATAESHILNKFDEGVIDAMNESGCMCLLIGAEAADPDTLKLIRKNIKPGDIQTTCERLSKRRIVPNVLYIVGFAGESEESIESTINEACEIIYRWPLVYIQFALFLPIPGTPLHAKALALGYENVTSIDGWKQLRYYTHTLNPMLTEKRKKAVRRCLTHYFYWGCERLREPRNLSLPEWTLNKSARFRLKHKLLGFPVEYKLYHMLRGLRRSFR